MVQQLVGQAKVIWNAMRDLKDRCVMTHDGKSTRGSGGSSELLAVEF